MDLEESTNECNTVKILTHEEFAAKYPSIDRMIKKSIDTLQKLSIDIQLSHAECNFPR